MCIVRSYVGLKLQCVCVSMLLNTHLLYSLMVYLLPQVGKAEKLKPLELELRRLEDLAESIVNDFAYMRAREEEMRDTNGTPPHTV